MASIDEIRETRLKKLNKLREVGVNPYPAKVPRDFPIAEFKKDFENLEKAGKEVALAGRIMAIRGQGAILFVVLFDGTEKIQAIFKKDEIAEKDFSLFVDTADIGDFVSVSGLAGKSKTGEESLFVGNGSDKVLRVAAECFIENGDKVLTFNPSFSVFNSAVELMGGEIVELDLLEKQTEPPARYSQGALIKASWQDI